MFTVAADFLLPVGHSLPSFVLLSLSSEAVSSPLEFLELLGSKIRDLPEQRHDLRMLLNEPKRVFRNATGSRHESVEVEVKISCDLGE